MFRIFKEHLITIAFLSAIFGSTMQQFAPDAWTPTTYHPRVYLDACWSNGTFTTLLHYY
jgi:hypothetical protein